MSTAAAAQQFETGLSMHREGRVGLAQSHYLRAVKLDPQHADAWHLLGVIAFQTGLLPKAIKHYRQALAVRPRFAQAWNNLALALKAKGDVAAATDAFAQALAVRPEYVEAAYNLGLLHEQAGDAPAAERAWQQALQWQPEHAPSLTNLGNLLRAQQRTVQAAALLERAHEVAPDADTAINLGLLMIDRGDWQRARSLAAQALAAQPGSADALEIDGVAARLGDDIEAALSSLSRAVALDPARGGACLEMGLARNAAGDWRGALDAFAQARATRWDSARLRWTQALALPALAASDDEVDAALASFAAGIDRLAAKLAPSGSAAASEALDAAAGVVAFNLHNLPHDTTALQSRFGDLLGETAARALPLLAAAPEWQALAHGGRLRVGFVSAYWSRHTVSRYFGDLVSALDPRRFERHVWHTGSLHDADSSALAAQVEHFVQTDAALPILAAQIRATRLDVLVFPDIGMDPRQQMLAALRLAPRQLLLYGHPVTSGLASVDAFAGAQAFEPTDAATHYRERLHRLPGIGAAPRRWDTPAQGAWFDPPRASRPSLLCAQSLSKCTPAFDHVLAQILAASSARLYLFDREGPLSRRYLAGLGAIAATYGVDVTERVVLLGARPYAEFLGALQGADLLLDTPWFSGGSTSLDALALGAPVLTWRAPMARGRQTAGMLDLLGVDGLVADDSAAYVARAVQLLGAPDERDELRRRLRAAAPILFDAGATHAAFADLLEQLATEGC